MFSLIITIIAIALVAALAIATIYYGGTAFNKSSDSAVVSETLNKSNQISGAFELYKADHGSLPTGTQQEIIDTLISKKYLSAWPQSTSAASAWSLTTDYATISGLTESQCISLNKNLGITGAVPTCSDPAYAGKSYCCTETTP